MANKRTGPDYLDQKKREYVPPGISLKRAKYVAGSTLSELKAADKKYKQSKKKKK